MSISVTPPEIARIPRPEPRSDDFSNLRASIIRSHKKSRPFDVIDEPPPRHTITIDSGIFTTPRHFYRNVYAPYEEQPPREVPKLPRWRKVESGDENEENEKMEEMEIEDLSDEAFEKRHSKHEAEERRAIKKDKSYQREQFYNSRLKVSRLFYDRRDVCPQFGLQNDFLASFIPF